MSEKKSEESFDIYLYLDEAFFFQPIHCRDQLFTAVLVGPQQDDEKNLLYSTTLNPLKSYHQSISINNH